MKAKNNKIEKYYEYNSFYSLLKNNFSIKSVFCSPEFRISICLSLFSIILFKAIYTNTGITEFKEMISSSSLSISMAFIGMLGFTISGLAIMSGTIGNKVIELMNDRDHIDNLIGVLFSFYYLGTLLVVSVVMFLVIYFISFLNIYISQNYFLLISTIVIFIFLYTILTGVSLLGTCINMFVLNYKFSTEQDNKKDSTVIKDFDLSIEYNKISFISLSSILISKDIIEDSELINFIEKTVSNNPDYSTDFKKELLEYIKTEIYSSTE